MAIYGAYDYSNHTLLNPLTDSDEFESVSYHEYTHYVLSCRSGVGMMLYCLEKILIPYDSKSDQQLYKTLTGFLNTHTNRVQEGMAVFVQCIMILVKEGKQASEEFLNDLRVNNRLYYEYVEPLIFIIKVLQDESDCNTILHISNLVFLLGIECMNSKIYELEPSSFNSNKIIKKIVSSNGFGENYLPDRRFIIYIKNCKKSNVKSSKEIENYILPLLSQDTLELSIEKNKIRLMLIKKFILKYFEESKYIKAYEHKLSKINTVEADMKDLYLQQLPSTFNQEELLKLSRVATTKEINLEIEKPYSIIFLFGTLEKSFEMVKEKVGLTTEIGYDKMYFASHDVIMTFNLMDKKILMALEDSKHIQKMFLSQLRKATIVTNYKNYDYEKDNIENHNLDNQDVFIYCDRTYGNTLPILDRWNGRELYYRYMTYENMAVLIVKIAAKRYFLLPMTLIVFMEADEDIQNNRRNMLMASDCESSEGFDNHILTDQNMVDKIDLIVNSLFFIDMK